MQRFKPFLFLFIGGVILTLSFNYPVRAHESDKFLEATGNLSNTDKASSAMVSKEKKTSPYPSANVSLSDFAELISEVGKDRKDHLLDLHDFLRAAGQPNTIILDARSRNMYMNRHLKGAINLPYTEFTSETLARIIPDQNTRILIYCNNNIEGDPIFFPGKGLQLPAAQKLNVEPRLLALNIPTHITLRGYGYKNTYELDELVNISDLRLSGMWEGIATNSYSMTKVGTASVK